MSPFSFEVGHGHMLFFVGGEGFSCFTLGFVNYRRAA